MLRKLCLVVMLAVMASGCSATHKLAAVQYTDFEIVDRLKDARILLAGSAIGVDSVKVRSTPDDENALGDYLWTRRTSINFSDENNPNRMGKPAKFMTKTINIPFKDPHGFFASILKKRGIEVSTTAQKRLELEIKKITLLTSQIGKEKFHACELSLGIKTVGQDLESIGVVKIPAPEMNFGRSESFTSATYKSDSKEQEAVELAFVDALQKGLQKMTD